MDKRILAQGFNKIAEGFNMLALAMEYDLVDNQVEEVVVKATESIKEVLEEEVLDVTNSPLDEKVSLKELYAGYTYNELKDEAKRLGIKVKGNTEVLRNTILNFMLVDGVEEEDLVEDVETNESIEETDKVEELVEIEDSIEIVEEEAVEEKEIVEDEFSEEVYNVLEEEEEEIEEEIEKEEPSFYDEMVENLKGYSDDELRETLESVDLSPRGGRQALLSKIVQAIEEGVIEWEDDDEDEEVIDTKEEEIKVEIKEEEPKAEIKKEEIEEIEEIEDTSKYLDKYYSETKVRQYACFTIAKNFRGDVEKDLHTPKEVIERIKNIDSSYISMGFKEDVEYLIHLKCMLVDEEGNLQEDSTPYYINETMAYCCAKPLVADGEDLKCTRCGGKYC